MRVAARTLLVLVIAFGVAACGDDSGSDDGSSLSDEEAFCQSGDQLQADVAALGDIDVVAGGTDAIEDAFSTLRADADALVASGQDLATDEINALERAVDQLGAALDTLSGEVTTENAGEVVAGVTEVATATQSVTDRLAETCN
jgi:hypothetical protein